MSRKTVLELMNTAFSGNYCVGAFNITNIIQMEAVIAAAEEALSPVIIQTSVTPAKFITPKVLGKVFEVLAAESCVPIALQLDHCRDVDFCKLCIDSGYSSVMFDGSSLSFEENIRQTKQVVEYAHQVGTASVEGELGIVCGVEDDIHVNSDQTALCPPELVIEFVRATGLDIMAPAIGTAHGVYATKTPKIDFERFEKIQQSLNGTVLIAPLVVHGGTGLSDEIVERLVGLRAAKFNVSTELKHVLIDTIYEYLEKSRKLYNPGNLDAITKIATANAVINWMTKLGSVGKANSKTIGEEIQHA